MTDEERERIRRRHIKHNMGTGVIRDMENAMLAAKGFGSAAPRKVRSLELPKREVREYPLTITSIATRNLRVKPGCPHPKWRKVDESFKQCTSCEFYALRQTPAVPDIKPMLPILSGRKLPPTWSTYASIIVLDNYVALRHHTLNELSWILMVKFPAGWWMSVTFHSLDWDRILKHLAPLLRAKKRDPEQIAHTIDTAITGRDQGDKSYRSMLEEKES